MAMENDPGLAKINLLPPVKKSPASPADTQPLQLLELTLDNDFGPLTTTLLNFVKVMNDSNSSGHVNPRDLFSELCDKSPMFSE